MYILPQNKWIPFRRLARSTVIEETVSAGFIRVPHDMTLTDLRHELRGQLIDDDLPEHFVFIKCVGRNFTQVRRNGNEGIEFYLLFIIICFIYLSYSLV